MSTVSEAAEANSRQEVLRRALVELKTARAELADERRRRAEPVAVVGAGCRFPGGAGVEEFWDLLVSGGSGVGEVPPDRWAMGEFYAPETGVAGRMYARHGGFLDGVAGFDAGLFGIPPREAASMDPQHRLVLEVGWEALEHAGLAPDALRGSRTGVFLGAGGSDFERASLLTGDVSRIDGYAATGSSVNFVANRLSYALGLEGPSLVVDTACSSSLVAVHLAVQSLRAGECDLAIAGGVNVLLSPVGSVALCQGRMLSPTGACRTFDADADGYVRGEGCGLIVLRRLSQAQARGEPILATILGTATNQDGRSSGITVPNAAAQQDVVRQALAVADVSGADVGYVEAHGTGTPLGDPIEVRALAQALGREREQPVMVGSVKTNIGHLEAAAGIAGLIKAVLAVERGVVPPHRNLSRPNPHIAWDELPIRVPTGVTPWDRQRRVAGVSAFGFGGTNAHVVIENPPRRDSESAPPSPKTPVVTKLGAIGADALQVAARRLAGFVSANRRLTPADVAWTAGTGRADLNERAAVVAATTDELLAGLRAVAVNRTDSPQVARGRRVPGAPIRVAFTAVRPGGVQISGARAVEVLTRLGGSSPAVAKLISTLTEVVGPLSELPDGSPLAAYALTVAIGRWWGTVGVAPALVTGHGIGGYAAAALAGACTPEDGARLVAAHTAANASVATAGALDEIRLTPPDTDLLIDGVRADAATATYWLDRARRPAPRDPDEPDLGAYIPIDLQDPGFVDAHTDPHARLLATLASVWSRGVEVDWTMVNPAPAHPIRLPTYPFQRTFFALPAATPERPGHPLRPRPVRPATGGVLAETVLSLGRLPFLGEHRVHGRLVVPGVVLLELVLQAGERLLGDGPSIEDLTIFRPVVLSDDDERAVQVILEPAAEGTARARVFAGGGAGEWQLHLEARVVAGAGRPAGAPPPGDVAAAPARYTETLDHDAFYRSAWHPSFALGESFRLIRTARRGPDAAEGRLTRPDPGCSGVLAGVRPELLALDACVQLVSAAAQPGAADADRPAFLGTGYRRIVLHRQDLPDTFTCVTRTRRGDDGSLVGDLRVTDDDGELLAELLGVTFRPVAARTLERLIGDPPDTTGPGTDLAGLREADGEERHARVLAHLIGLTAGVLGAKPEDVEPRVPLYEYADSLMLTELQAGAERDFGVAVPLESIFEDGRLTALAELISGELAKATEPAPSTAPARASGKGRRPRQRPLSVAEMSERAELDPAITAHGAAEPAANAPQDVLLTGATGFVGAFLLGELLSRGAGRVHCLVRADDEAHALRRVLANLERYGVDAPHSRIAQVAGDLGAPRFGLSEEAFAGLYAQIGAVYHCGALVKWTYPYEALEAANVTGTREALRLATAGAVPRPVHFVSTVGVFSSREYAADVVRETDDLLGSGPLVVGYAQTKWVAERMVRTAAERGVPVTIHRINTGGHSATGAFNRLDHLSMMVKGCVEAGIAPEHVDMPVQPAPVDYVARALVGLGSRPELYGRTFHLVNPHELAWPAFFDIVEEYGYPLERLPFDDWRNRIISRGSGTVAMLGLIPFLEGAVDDVRLPLSDSSLTRDALAGMDIACPLLGPDLVRTYLDAFSASGFIDPPNAR